MKKTAYSSVVLVLLIGVTVFAFIRLDSHSKHAPSTQKPDSQSTVAAAKTKPTSGTTKPTSTTSPTAAASPCDTVFSLAAAQQALGSDASAASTNGTTSQTANTTVTSCSYSAVNGNASITATVAKTSVGASDNDVAFGSGRPGDAATVTGFGSVAFWQPSTNTLNVLQNNNWFVVSGTNQGNDGLATATQIATVAHLAD